jgi:hypothetical protein
MVRYVWMTERLRWESTEGRGSEHGSNEVSAGLDLPIDVPLIEEISSTHEQSPDGQVIAMYDNRRS